MTWFAMSADKPDGPIPTPAGGSKRSAIFKRQPRILIVEDEFLIALELENRLLDADFEVVGIATTAGEAIALASSQTPDLAIMDIRLAGRRDGVEAAIEIFTTLGIRSIFSSAHDDAATRKRAIPASPIGWLRKPYSANALIELIKSNLE